MGDLIEEVQAMTSGYGEAMPPRQYVVPKIVLSESEARADSSTGYWQDEGNCLGADPDLFFPSPGDSLKAAKAVCNSCVVRAECLEYALENGEKYGIWGGMSERERRRIRRQRAIARNTGQAAIAS